MSFETLLLVYIDYTGAIFMSQIAGGGVSLIMIPFLLFLGVPAHTVLGSMKFSSIGGLSSIYKYTKNKSIDWSSIPLYAAISLLAVFFGTKLLLSIDPSSLITLFGILIFAMVPFVFLKPNWGAISHRHAKTKKQRGIGHVLFFLVSILQSAFGAGLGLVITYIFVTYYGYTLIETHGTRRTALFILNVSSAIVYAFAGIIDYRLGVVLLAGSLTGGYIGSHTAIKKGNKFLKYCFTGLILVSAFKLLFF